MNRRGFLGMLMGVPVVGAWAAAPRKPELPVATSGFCQVEGDEEPAAGATLTVGDAETDGVIAVWRNGKQQFLKFWDE